MQKPSVKIATVSTVSLTLPLTVPLTFNCSVKLFHCQDILPGSSYIPCWQGLRVEVDSVSFISIRVEYAHYRV